MSIGPSATEVVPPFPARDTLFTRDFLAIFSSVAMAWLGAAFLFPVLPLYVTSLGGDNVAVGVIGAVYGIAAMSGRLVGGAMLDYFGRKRLLLSGFAIATLCLVLYAVAGDMVSLAAVRVVHGLAFALITTTGVVIAGHLAPAARRGEAFGYYSTCANIPLAVAPGIALFLMGVSLPPLSGFSLVFIAASLSSLLGLVLALRLPEMGGRSTGRTLDWIKKLRVSNFLCAEAVLPALVNTVVAFLYGSVIYFLPLAANVRGGNVGWFLLSYALTVIVMRPTAGRWSDRFGRARVAVPSMIAGALGMVLLAVEPAGWVLPVAGVFVGIALGAVWPVVTAMVADVVPEARRGAGMGTLYLGVDGGSLAGSFVSGVIAEYAGYSVAFLVAAAIVVITALGLLAYSPKLMGGGTRR